MNVLGYFFFNKKLLKPNGFIVDENSRYAIWYYTRVYIKYLGKKYRGLPRPCGERMLRDTSSA